MKKILLLIFVLVVSFDAFSQKEVIFPTNGLVFWEMPICSKHRICYIKKAVFVPSNQMDAVFTIMKSPLKVKVNKIKETATHYHGLIVSGAFFKQNELIVNKVTGELSITYKLKGKRAPWLICKSAMPVLGVYSGRIITNNEHAVDVGYFTFKFKD